MIIGNIAKPDIEKSTGTKAQSTIKLLKARIDDVQYVMDPLFNGEALHTHHRVQVKDGGTDKEEIFNLFGLIPRSLGQNNSRGLLRGSYL